jgi:nicotinamidase-related amidase
VLATVLEAQRRGFDAHLILEATKAVTPEGGQEAIRTMREPGAKIVDEKT